MTIYHMLWQAVDFADSRNGKIPLPLAIFETTRGNLIATALIAVAALLSSLNSIYSMYVAAFYGFRLRGIGAPGSNLELTGNDHLRLLAIAFLILGTFSLVFSAFLLYTTGLHATFTLYFSRHPMCTQCVNISESAEQSQISSLAAPQSRGWSTQRGKKRAGRFLRFLEPSHSERARLGRSEEIMTLELTEQQSAPARLEGSGPSLRPIRPVHIPSGTPIFSPGAGESAREWVARRSSDLVGSFVRDV